MRFCGALRVRAQAAPTCDEMALRCRRVDGRLKACFVNGRPVGVLPTTEPDADAVDNADGEEDGGGDEERAHIRLGAEDDGGEPGGVAEQAERKAGRHGEGGNRAAEAGFECAAFHGSGRVIGFFTVQQAAPSVEMQTGIDTLSPRSCEVTS